MSILNSVTISVIILYYYIPTINTKKCVHKYSNNHLYNVIKSLHVFNIYDIKIVYYSPILLITIVDYYHCRQYTTN